MVLQGLYPFFPFYFYWSFWGICRLIEGITTCSVLLLVIKRIMSKKNHIFNGQHIFKGVHSLLHFRTFGFSFFYGFPLSFKAFLVTHRSSGLPHWRSNVRHSDPLSRPNLENAMTQQGFHVSDVNHVVCNKYHHEVK